MSAIRFMVCEDTDGTRSVIPAAREDIKACQEWWEGTGDGEIVDLLVIEGDGSQTDLFELLDKLMYLDFAWSAFAEILTSVYNSGRQSIDSQRLPIGAQTPFRRPYLMIGYTEGEPFETLMKNGYDQPPVHWMAIDVDGWMSPFLNGDDFISEDAERIGDATRDLTGIIKRMERRRHFACSVKTTHRYDRPTHIMRSGILSEVSQSSGGLYS